MAVTSTRVSIFAGRTQLATTSASSLYINPAIPESATLANRDHTGVAPSASPHIHQLTAIPAVQTEITLAVLAQKEILDLSTHHSLKILHEGSAFVCDASITQFAEDHTATTSASWLKKFHLRGPQQRQYQNIIFSVSKISDAMIHEKEELAKSALERCEESQEQLHTPSAKSILSTTQPIPTPETPVPDPAERVATKKSLFETPAQGISDTKKLRYPDTPTP
ncbi:hypothetical protein L1987_57913 [Smallanthus sonchifolius]|uniref:Uncharacterized protein n=1 Tax=Smallanthus sonchifolius TaxID=185202 RepID=A0ACB9DEG9_9ASTR|nr:hypothetical protein L1987_57913 [Smallanthus sonchifolius]